MMERPVFGYRLWYSDHNDQEKAWRKGGTLFFRAEQIVNNCNGLDPMFRRNKARHNRRALLTLQLYAFGPFADSARVSARASWRAFPPLTWPCLGRALLLYTDHSTVQQLIDPPCDRRLPLVSPRF